MSAGAQVLHAAIERRPLDVERHLRLVDGPAVGATVLFTGQVRHQDEGHRVSAPEYSAHSTAQAILDRLARESAAAEGVRAVAVGHRIGRLGPGETALSCAVSAEHRRQAFDVCLHLVEAVKHRLAIWKDQIFANGSDEWVGSA